MFSRYEKIKSPCYLNPVEMGIIVAFFSQLCLQPIEKKLTLKLLFLKSEGDFGLDKTWISILKK